MITSENISGESELLCRCGAIFKVQSISMSLSPSLSESNIRASHRKNSGKRAYCPSREIQSLQTKNITFKENKLPMLFQNCFIAFFLVIWNSSNMRRIRGVDEDSVDEASV